MAKIRLYRRDENTGQRIPWVFELESDNKTITSEYVDEKLWSRMKEDQARAVGAVQVGDEIQPRPEEKAYVTRQTPAGEERIELTSFDRDFAQWMIPDMENPFPGTESLRTTYFTLQKQQLDSPCSNCDATRLILEYKERVLRYVEGN